MRHSAGNTRKGCYENIPSLQNFPPIQKNISKSNTKHPIADNFSQGKKLDRETGLSTKLLPNQKWIGLNFRTKDVSRRKSEISKITHNSTLLINSSFFIKSGIKKFLNGVKTEDVLEKWSNKKIKKKHCKFFSWNGKFSG